MDNRSLKRLLQIIGILIVISIISLFTNLYMDWLWFKSINFQTVFTTILFNQVGLYAVIFILAFLLFYANLNLARKNIMPKHRPPETDDGREIIYLNPEKNSPWKEFLQGKNSRWAIVIFSILGALMVSSASGDKWIIVQKFINKTSFGTLDPIFHKDVSFYVFNLAFYKYVYHTLMSALILVVIVTALIYILDRTSDLMFNDWKEFSPGKSHIAILIAAMIGLKAWGYKLAAYGILTSPSGIVFGATYSDVHAKLLAYRILMVVALAVAVIIIVNIYSKKFSWVVYSIGTWLVLSFLLNGLYPVFIQKIVVQPNEFNKEKPYIKSAIQFTRHAYGLDKVDNRKFKIDYNLTMEDIDKTTVDNVRLWDWQPLTDTYRSLQELRPYYVFHDIDIDRYMIDGEYRQVMLSAREMEQDNLQDRAKTWINERLMYTHGYGVAMSPVNEIAEEGFPRMFIKDIPPQFATNIKVSRPEIYFGERTNSYVIVNTEQKEFDYPMGNENVYTTYKGKNGVKINSFSRRLLFSYILRDYKLILSSDISNNSQVLYNRNVVDRIKKVAPYLDFDSDPYIVVNTDGKLFWILDAYTYTDQYPYSEPFDKQGYNYVRNSVKITCDAYTGELKFYIADDSDPIIKTYAKIFPNIYKPLSAMPAGLKSHVRYPVDMFTIQTQMYRTFHMQDPYVFYNKEDIWVIPSEIVEGKEQKVEPYYIIMRLPGNEKSEYILMLPYTPNNRPNMIAWMCARMDGDNYGKMLVYSFPKQETVYGPMQIEARISQDTEISRQLTLWDQKGSQTYRGNLIVIPINNSILYIEPLYLQAESSRMPELKRVIAAYGNEVVMEPSLDEALLKIFGEGKSKPAEPSETVTDDTADSSIKELAAKAREYYELANELLREGDWAGYGENINKLNKVIKRLEEVAGK